MNGLLFNYHHVLPTNPKVFFDTNAYRNFAERYLGNNNDFLKIINHLKACEKNASVTPSSNLLSVMELYQHLSPGDPARDTCERAVRFSFLRSCVNGSFNYQPLVELEIASRLFEMVADNDAELNGYFLSGHEWFCSGNADDGAITAFIRQVTEQLNSYKDISYNSIINNLHQLYSSFDMDTMKFSEQDYQLYKNKFRNKRKWMFEQLGTSLCRAYQKRLGVSVDEQIEKILINRLIEDYKPALFYYIKMLENFSNNKPSSKSLFLLNKNDLVDALILFSVVPEENIWIVTNEKKIHAVFKDIERPSAVMTLEAYLEKIGFKGSGQS